ncbi:MAG: type I glyceraldehyde-3-phosphate dehydrogenase [Patescibacteria group bacterium]|nr:type I glyceraldehyde-3-phosphate dehydrogenase [Patescibacteria group bacterium]
MTKPSIGINGFGRIGRLSFRVWWQFHRQDMNLLAINTSGSMELEDWFHLVKYDSSYGLFNEPIKITRHQSKKDVTDEDSVLGTVTIGEFKITVTAQRDPLKIPWGQLGVETVIESTGAFRTAKTASAHLTAGAKAVILSAPAKGIGVGMSIIGVNDSVLENGLISNASCTTNCVAPVVKVMHQAFGVQKAMLTTIHAYTSDQNLHDNSHKDLRRARAAAQNIIPTSTGAAQATTQIVPELKDKFDGLAIRVPIATGSLADMVFVLDQDVTVDSVNQALTKASQEKHWQGILAVTNEPIVSADIIGRSESSIVDLSLTSVVGGNLVKVISWYDNEWGYCHRLLEQVLAISK